MAELHDARGRRLYLTGAERAAFLAAAARPRGRQLHLHLKGAASALASM